MCEEIGLECEGIVSELEGIDLRDRRLNQRSQKIIATLAGAWESEMSCQNSHGLVTVAT